MMYHKQTSINLMGDTLQNLLLQYSGEDNMDNVKAIYSEWVVDNQDPEDNEYEFLFIQELV